jgi:hypothetical protein
MNPSDINIDIDNKKVIGNFSDYFNKWLIKRPFHVSF